MVTKTSQRGYKIHCPYCGYQWTPRIESPKECPECKRYIRKARKHAE